MIWGLNKGKEVGRSTIIFDKSNLNLIDEEQEIGMNMTISF